MATFSSFEYSQVFGAHITEELTDDADIERERRTLAARGNMIRLQLGRSENHYLQGPVLLVEQLMGK